MFVLGITGGIGCGKTTAAAILAAHGLPLLDADVISHEVTAPGGVAIPEIIERFGPEYIKADGSLDREAMAHTVFTDRKRLDQLSLIIHRHVMAEITRKRLLLQKQKAKAVVLDVPVPVREGFLDSCDQIWVIWADLELRLGRLQARGLSREEALRRMQIQMTEDEYRALGTEFILNNGSVAELETQLDALLNRELLGRGIPVQTGLVYANEVSADSD
ncbi:MAG: dephospho-CoA kinase [Clostridia bacterium]|nr:dephospho-CoA kinase [Clostridia bacterium]NLF20715.1 dephospho-CoA kinase [Clostridiaceae bacterium]